MDARIAILDNVDKVTLNGDIYPRDVIERAINLWNGQTMAVIHADNRPCEIDPHRLADAIGVASHIRIDVDTNQVVADVKFAIPPETLKGFKFEPSGEIVRDGTNITDFKITALVIAPGVHENDDD